MTQRIDGWLAYANEKGRKEVTKAFDTNTMLGACDASARMYVADLKSAELKREKRFTITVSLAVILPGDTHVTDRHNDIRWYDYVYYNGVLKRKMGFDFVNIES
jgi:hypothetical protein